MAALYEFVVTDLATGVVRDGVRLSGVSYEDVLNRRGNIAGRVARAAASTRRSTIQENTTGLYVLRDGQPVAGGYVESIQATTAGGELALACPGFLNYYDHRVLRENRTYSQVDQATIMADLVAYTTAQASTSYGATVGPGEGIPMARSAPPTGTLRDRTYLGGERSFIGDLLRKITEVEGGPDMAVVTSVGTDAGGSRLFTNTFTVAGQQGGNLGQVVRYGPGVRYAITYDGTQQINRGEAMNDADVTLRLFASATAGGPIAWDGVTSRSGVSDVNTLTSWAQRLVTAYGTPPILLAMSLDNSREVPAGQVRPGDQVRVIIDHNYVQVDATYRVVGTKVTVGTGGSETLDLALALPAATGAATL